ncbi:hypothetical protein LB505_013379 [Fusarium chuoi]|nr:hypothetical protein LB505_013379 [Fusarium chuoi]
MTWAVLDTFLDTDFPVCPEIITFELDGESRVAWIPRERGMSRFYVLLKGEITQQLAEESIKEHLAPYRLRNDSLDHSSPRKATEESSWPETLLTFIPSTVDKA